MFEKQEQVRGDDYYFADRIIAGLAQFDVIGVAGNTRLAPNHLSWHTNHESGEPDLPYLNGALALQGFV
ncbi:MAG: hypothetical protein ACK58N_14705 [Synechocystis sp.]|jgi:hypothetical protein